MVSEITAEPATWGYVNDAWGGLEVGSPVVTAGQVDLPLTLMVHAVKQVDSGVCTDAIVARVDGTRVIIGLKRGVCGEGSLTDYTAHFSVPPAGRYDVVYDDAQAGFPSLGEITIP